MTSFIEKVKANEPGTQVFELDLDRDKSQFLTFEVFVSCFFPFSRKTLQSYLSFLEHGHITSKLLINLRRGRYEDQEAIDAHLKSSYLAELLASEEKEQLKRAENEIFTLELIKRFIRDPVESNV